MADETATGTVVDDTGTAGPTTGDDSRLGEQQPQDNGQGRDAQDTSRQATREGEGVEGEPRRSRAADRITELSDRARQNEMEAKFWRQKFEGSQAPAGEKKGRELPPELKDLDTAMNPLLKHYLTPLEQTMQQARTWQEWMTDRAEFYDDYPEYREKKHREVIEAATMQLSQRLGQRVDRSDVLMYLRGHDKYGTQFVDAKRQQAQQAEDLAESEVAARRSAGKLGGRAATMRTREPGPADLKSMKPEDRIKFFEEQRGEEPF